MGEVGERQPALEQRRVGELELVAGGDELGRRTAADPRLGAEVPRRRVAHAVASAPRRPARRPRRARAPGAAARPRPAARARSRRPPPAPPRTGRPRSCPASAARWTSSCARCLPTRCGQREHRPARRARSRPGRRGSPASARRARAGRRRARRPAPATTAAAEHASGRNAHSVFQAAPSRSCSPTSPSSASPAAARTTRASVHRCSERSGLRFCGIVMLPTTPSVGASETSPISGALEVVDLVADLRERARDQSQQRGRARRSGRARSASWCPGRRGRAASSSRRCSSGPCSP